MCQHTPIQSLEQCQHLAQFVCMNFIKFLEFKAARLYKTVAVIFELKLGLQFRDNSFSFVLWQSSSR